MPSIDRQLLENLPMANNTWRGPLNGWRPPAGRIGIRLAKAADRLWRRHLRNNYSLRMHLGFHIYCFYIQSLKRSRFPHVAKSCTLNPKQVPIRFRIGIEPMGNNGKHVRRKTCQMSVTKATWRRRGKALRSKGRSAKVPAPSDPNVTGRVVPDRGYDFIGRVAGC